LSTDGKQAPTGHRRRNREQRRVALGLRLLAAIDVLEAEGETFTAASVERLTAAAGTGRSTFYLYFQDKTELLEVWFAPIAEELETAFSAWLAIDDKVSEESVRVVVDRVVGTFREHSTALSIVFDATSYDAIIRDLVATSKDRVVATLAKHIRLGQRHGWINEGIAPRETATWLTWMGYRGGHEVGRMGDEQRILGLVDAYAHVAWLSLYAHAPARKRGPAGPSNRRRSRT